jgi:microcystin-dependent protein
MDDFIGIIKLFAGNFAPQGWALCSGQLLPINQNQALFSILGTAFGGDGITTFGLPDLRSRVPVGAGMGTPPNGLAVVNIGQLGGESTHMLVPNEMPAHTHTAAVAGAAKLNVSSANASQAAPAAGSTIAAPGALVSRAFTPTLGFNTTAPNTTLNAASVDASGITVANANAGSNAPHNNMQPYQGMVYIIALQGIFPSRS